MQRPDIDRCPKSELRTYIKRLEARVNYWKSRANSVANENRVLRKEQKDLESRGYHP